MSKITLPSLESLAIKHYFRYETIQCGARSYMDIEDGYLVAYFDEFGICDRLESYGFNGYILPSTSTQITCDNNDVFEIKAGSTRFILGDKHVEE